MFYKMGGGRWGERGTYLKEKKTKQNEIALENMFHL